MNVQVVTYKDLSFINVTNPGTFEFKYLKNNFKVSSLHLDDYVNKTQVPKIELTKDYTLLVLDFPVYNPNGPQAPVKNAGKTKGAIGTLLNIPQTTLSSVSIPQILPTSSDKKRRLFSTQVDLFIGKNYLIVVHEGMLGPINDIFSLCQKTLSNRERYLGNGPVYLAYLIIDALVDTCFPVINEISSTIDRIDKELEKKQSPKTIEEISLVRRNVVVFHTMIKPIMPIFKEIEEGKYKELNGSMQPYWGNILDHLQKIWDRLEDNQELIEGIAESNESLLSFRNNEIVKFLTVITSFAFPFVIVNNLYSMNIAGLPFAQNPLIVWILFGLIFISGIVIMLYFKLRGWV